MPRRQILFPLAPSSTYRTDYPWRHWELGKQTSQPTHRIIDSRQRADFVTPSPTAKVRTAPSQKPLLLDERSTEDQQYSHTAVINAVRAEVDKWRALPESAWRATPETARLLKHWRQHKFAEIRPFFCQIEAIETAIWLIEVAPQSGKHAESFLAHLEVANAEANPGLSRLGLSSPPAPARPR